MYSLPLFVMVEITALDQRRFKISLVDKKHECELDYQTHELPVDSKNGFGFVASKVADYKTGLLIDNVI